MLKINQENQTYLLKKEVFWSMFQTGMTIEQEFQEFFVQNEFGVRSPGQFQKIEIMIDGQIFDAKLVNVNFDRKKYKDLFFARPFWRKLQNVFGEFCISKMEKIAKCIRCGFKHRTPPMQIHSSLNC